MPRDIGSRIAAEENRDTADVAFLAKAPLRDFFQHAGLPVLVLVEARSHGSAEIAGSNGVHPDVVRCHSVARARVTPSRPDFEAP